MNRYEWKQEQRRERLERRAEKLDATATREFRKGDLREEFSGIPFGQPILVGHHSEGKHRRAIERADNAMRRGVEAYKAAGEARAKAAAVGTAGISSDDPDAPSKLAEELAEKKKRQALMVAANKLIRKKDQAGLVALVGEKVAAALMMPGQVGGQGFAHFQLSNNNANIRRIEARIATLARNAKREPKEVLHNSGVRMVENVEDNRLQLFFPGKPAEAVRAKLKAGGFRWAPSEGAWQRMLSNGAVWQAQQILAGLVGGAA